MKRTTLRSSLLTFLAVAFATVALPATALAQAPQRPALRSAPGQVSKTARPKLRIPPRCPQTTPPASKPPVLRPTLRLPAGYFPQLKTPWTGGNVPVIPATLPNLLPPAANGQAPVIPATLPELFRYIPAWQARAR